MAADCMGTAAGFAAADRLPYNNSGSNFAELANHGWTLDPPRLLPTSDHGTGDAGSPRTAMDPRHQTKSNVVFCDGHGETTLPYKLGYRTDADGKYLDTGTPESLSNNHWFSGTSRDQDPPGSS